MDQFPMDGLHLIQLNESDLVALQAISKSTFHEAFEWGNTADNLANYLETAFSKEALLEEMSNSQSQFYFVNLDETTVAYFKVNWGDAQTETLGGNGFELQRIYVAAAHQGKKIGEHIIAKVVELAKAQDADFIWLGVWDKNDKAVKFYERHGFEIIDSHSFMMGDEEQNDFIMKKKMKGIRKK